MNPETKALRSAVKHIHGATVRVSGKNAWVSSKHPTYRRMHELKAALEARGYRCELYGKPGTSGEFIVDVLL